MIAIKKIETLRDLDNEVAELIGETMNDDVRAELSELVVRLEEGLQTAIVTQTASQMLGVATKDKQNFQS